MAERGTLGPIQVADNSVLAINDALRQLLQHIDALKGLGGGTVVHAGITADSFRVKDGNGQVIHGIGTTT